MVNFPCLFADIKDDTPNESINGTSINRFHFLVMRPVPIFRVCRGLNRLPREIQQPIEGALNRSISTHNGVSMCFWVILSLMICPII